MLDSSSAPHARRHRRSAFALLALLALLAAAPAAHAVQAYGKEQKERIAALPAPYQSWLADVEVIISNDEVEAFLQLDKDYQRDAFIKRFWRVRDRFSDTARNEFEERYRQRLAEAKQTFGGLEEDRSKMLLLNGFPAARFEVRCTSVVRPLDMWFYAGSDQVHFNFWVIFYREGSRYRLWRPFDGVERLTDSVLAESSAAAGGGNLLQRIVRNCRDGEKIAAGIAYVLREGPLSYEQILGRLQETPKIAGQEWVETFNSYTTDVPEDAEQLAAELTLNYPGHRQSRTALQGTVAVERSSAGVAELAESRSHNFLLTGEVLTEGELFDTFRYKFDFPASQVDGERIPLVFERFLRPGSYRLVVKVEDLNSSRFYRVDRQIDVPQVDAEMPAPPMDEETARLLAEANAALASGETTLQIVEPRGQLHTGYVRFDTLTTGDRIDHVAFALDGDQLLTKRTPPYSVDLDLGKVPQPRTLTAVAYDAGGTRVAYDELALNAGGRRFSVDLVEPQKGAHYERSLSAEARVEVPDKGVVERVEFFLNETLVATLYQEPWVQPIVLPEGQPIAYVRAVAYLPDGNSTEDLVFVNAPDYLEEIDVQFVELYATVVDREGHPLEGFARDDFNVSEDGVPQQIVRFERVSDLPVHAGILLDVSASMKDQLERAQSAALEFFQQTVKPRDRATVITFNDHPNLAVQFTNDVNELAGGLAGLKAERGTSLYDSIIFALYYFNGVKGQRALLVLSDGKDESSRFTWDQALEYARRAGVAIYAVSLGDADHKKLTRLAEATGGRSWRIDGAEELPAIYEAIEKELRSKYLIAYQSTNTTESKDFRGIEVKVARGGAEVKTMQGYYP